MLFGRSLTEESDDCPTKDGSEDFARRLSDKREDCLQERHPLLSKFTYVQRPRTKVATTPRGRKSDSHLATRPKASGSGPAQERVPADCVGLECAERRVRDLSHSAAKGFVDGLGLALKIPLLAAAFGAGVLGALVVFLLLRLRRPVLIATDAGPMHSHDASHSHGS